MEIQLPKRSDPSYRRMHYLKNKEKCRIQRRALYLKKRALILSQSVAYNKSHPELVKAAQKKWRVKNKQREADRFRDYSRRNPGRMLAKARKRQALKKKAEVNLAGITEWMSAVRGRATTICYYCEREFSSQNIHFDHIVALSNGGEHSVRNLCVSCPDCNLSKGAKPLRVWIKTGQQLLEV